MGSVMTRHGRCKKKGRTALLALLFAFVLPSSALAWDSPLQPVSPATDTTAEHGLGLDTSTIPTRFSTSAIEDVVVDAADLPATVDLTPWAMPSGNQGSVGSCAAWATDYSVLGYWMNKQHIAGGPLAPMFTYSQYSATYSGGADRGSSLDYHAQVAKTGGIDALSDYPQGNYDFHTLPTTAQKANAVQWKVTSWNYLPTQQSATATVTQDSIKTALANGDPVVLGMPVYTSFDAVRATNHGFYNPTTLGTFRGNHAVTPLGYHSTGVRIQNQWDTWWGDNGFATLSWAFVNKYVFGAMEVGPMVDPDPVPKLVVNPVISGQLGRGQTLTATAGKYTASPTGFDYQWQRGDGTTFTDISGATSSTYVTTQDDVTKKIRVVVDASNADGSVSGTSNVLGPIVPVIPTSSEAPVLSGTAKRGEALTVTKGAWTDNPTTWTYVWQRSANDGTTWTTIAGATTTAYTLVAGDLTQKIRVNVTAKNAVGTSTAASSNVVGPIGANAPVNSVVPGVTGTVARGNVLTATPGTWAGAGNTYKYQWHRKPSGAGTATTGATAATYTVAVADIGATLRVTVAATNSDGTASASSDATAAATKSLPVATEIPAPTGTAARGNALTAKPGTWEGIGNTYKYQWQRKTSGDWGNIAGATAVTYTLTAADTGASIRVQVTATNVDGFASDFSAEAGPVAKAPPVNTVVPVVTGTAARASTLSSTAGTWTGPGNVYTYQWQKKAAGDWEDITGATKSTYLVQKTDEDALLRVEVTATNVDATVPVVSVATATVAAAPPVNTIVPLLSGTVARTKPLTATPGSWTG